MLTFAIDQSPPTRQELVKEKISLGQQKKQQIKFSIISDSFHGTALLAIYFLDLLSGYGLLVAVGLGTSLAIIIATSLKHRLRSAELAILVPTSGAAVLAVIGILHWWMAEPLTGSVLSGLVAGSIVCAGAVIGRRIMRIYLGLEQLKCLSEDEQLEDEMRRLCCEYPAIEAYRQEALQVLRPNLIFGELQAMRAWVKSQATPSLPT